jgi:hypothetical protein
VSSPRSHLLVASAYVAVAIAATAPGFPAGFWSGGIPEIWAGFLGAAFIAGALIAEWEAVLLAFVLVPLAFLFNEPDPDGAGSALWVLVFLTPASLVALALGVAMPRLVNRRAGRSGSS